MILCHTPKCALIPLTLLAAGIGPVSAQILPGPGGTDGVSPGADFGLPVEGAVFEAKGDPLQPKKGERTVSRPEEVAPREREWFGQATPWQKWSRLSGDWGGWRNSLEESGLTIGMTYTFDGATVLDGGVRRRSAGRGLLDLNVTLDTEALFGLKGGTAFAQYYFRHGRVGGEDVGDAQGYSNIDAERLSRAEEIWYEQKFAGDRVRLKLGQIDANAEFAFIEAAGDFINSSAGFSPTIVSLPTYPDPALGVNLFIHPTDQLYVGGGLFGKNIKELDRRNFDHPFLIGELGFTHGGEGRFAAGRLAFGAWRVTEDLDQFAGGVASGTAGFYVVAEQQVWRENPEREEDTQGITLFGQYGWADDEVSEFAQHLSFGGSASGLIDGRDDDVTGLRLSWVQLSREPGTGFDANETGLELFYKAQITPFFSVKPGVQWIHNPGGVDRASDAIVGTLRASIDF